MPSLSLGLGRKVLFLVAWSVLVVGCAAEEGQHPGATPEESSDIERVSLSDQEFWDLSNEIFEVAFEHSIPLSEVTIETSRSHILIVVRAEESEELAMVVVEELGRLAQKSGVTVEFRYDPDAEHVTFEGR